MSGNNVLVEAAKKVLGENGVAKTDAQFREILMLAGASRNSEKQANGKSIKMTRLGISSVEGGDSLNFYKGWDKAAATLTIGDLKKTFGPEGLSVKSLQEKLGDPEAKTDATKKTDETKKAEEEVKPTTRTPKPPTLTFDPSSLGADTVLDRKEFIDRAISKGILTQQDIQNYNNPSSSAEVRNAVRDKLFNGIGELWLGALGLHIRDTLKTPNKKYATVEEIVDDLLQSTASGAKMNTVAGLAGVGALSGT